MGIGKGPEAYICISDKYSKGLGIGKDDGISDSSCYLKLLKYGFGFLGGVEGCTTDDRDAYTPNTPAKDCCTPSVDKNC
jgi:hypothetical protein